jgi:aspartate/methionine/tyrosine aminotransferase
MANYAALSDDDDTTFAMRLVTEAGVATVPGSSFYWDKGLSQTTIRFAYCKKERTLHTAADQLLAWRRKVHKG